jgi:hypothetical protein
MRKVTFLAVLITSFFTFVSCQKEDPLTKVKKKTMNMKEFEEDLTVPSGLWKAMESSYLPLVMDAEGKAIKDDSAKEESTKTGTKKKAPSEFEDLLKKKPPLDPIAITVYLIEKTPDVLGGQNYELNYPPGGGLLDYRVFVPESKDGTFFIKIKYGSEMDAKETRIYYLSNAKIREVDGKPLGNGCDRYFDITHYWKKSMDGEGLMLNTKNFRHISVTAGTLFFVAPYRGKLRISHLSLKDTRHRDLLCSSD